MINRLTWLQRYSVLEPFHLQFGISDRNETSLEMKRLSLGHVRVLDWLREDGRLAGGLLLRLRLLWFLLQVAQLGKGLLVERSLVDGCFGCTQIGSCQQKESTKTSRNT